MSTVTLPVIKLDRVQRHALVISVVGKSFYVLSPDEHDAVTELLRLGLMVKTDRPGEYEPTPLGRHVASALQNPALSKPKRKLLASIAHRNGRHVRGAEVRVARAMQAMGLVTLVDDGEGPVNDGERWWVHITEAGVTTLRVER